MTYLLSSRRFSFSPLPTPVPDESKDSSQIESVPDFLHEIHGSMTISMNTIIEESFEVEELKHGSALDWLQLV